MNLVPAEVHGRGRSGLSRPPTRGPKPPRGDGGGFGSSLPVAQGINSLCADRASSELDRLQADRRDGPVDDAIGQEWFAHGVLRSRIAAFEDADTGAGVGLLPRGEAGPQRELVGGTAEIRQHPNGSPRELRVRSRVGEGPIPLAKRAGCEVGRIRGHDPRDSGRIG